MRTHSSSLHTAESPAMHLKERGTRGQCCLVRKEREKMKHSDLLLLAVLEKRWLSLGWQTAQPSHTHWWLRCSSLHPAVLENRQMNVITGSFYRLKIFFKLHVLCCVIWVTKWNGIAKKKKKKFRFSNTPFVLHWWVKHIIPSWGVKLINPCLTMKITIYWPERVIFTCNISALMPCVFSVSCLESELAMPDSKTKHSFKSKL